MSQYAASPTDLRSFRAYFRHFLTTLSAMVALAPLPLSITGVLPTYEADRTVLVASASFLCLLAFSMALHFRVEIGIAMGYFNPRRGPDRLGKNALRRTLLLVLPVFLGVASGCAVLQYQTLLDDSVAVAETIRIAETRAIESNSEFAVNTLQILSSPGSVKEHLHQVAKFRNAWPALNGYGRAAILATMQAPPFRNALKCWYLLAFVCGELSLCLMGLRNFQRDLYEKERHRRN